MDASTLTVPTRRPRFRRAPEPPAFRLTIDDIEIVRHVARHRFLRSTHIAALLGRSLDRTNDRLARLFHAGYLDRPRAQLDYYPTTGSGPMVYALADGGARLLKKYNVPAFSEVEWTRKNREVLRPQIEHQLETMDFYVSLECACRNRSDVQLLHPEDLIAAFPDQTSAGRNPFTLRATISDRGITEKVSVVPDFAFGLLLRDGSRRYYVVEIDRGTMPIARTNSPRQNSFQEKMRTYLGAHAGGQHERRLGWNTFRVLTVTIDEYRVRSMNEALRALHVPHSPGPSLFFFATRDELTATDPISLAWRDGNDRAVCLI